MFLGISTKELAMMDYSDVLPHEQFDRELFKLHYNQKLNFAEISRRTGWDYSYIKTVTYKNKKRGTNKKLINRGGTEPRDYKALDNEYFPIVKEAINKLKNSKDEKPQKVSLMKVEKIVCLSEGTLYKMPKCYKYIQANIEPIEAYWIRCLNWNYNQLILKNDSLTKSKLIKPLNINNGDISRICSYLDKNKKINTSKEIVDIIASGKYS